MASLDRPPIDVEAAIARVLAAEAAAVVALQAAEVDAQRSLEAARARVRRIDEHTSERLQRMSLRIEANCARELAHLAAITAAPAPIFEHDVNRLMQVVDALAADLTGGAG